MRKERIHRDSGQFHIMAKIVFATEAPFVFILLYYNDRIYLAMSLIILNNLVYYVSKIIEIGAIV